jgi:nucleoside-diphosphate-sugar epimerase
MAKTVLILGASGKIGTHSAAAFERAGWTVRLFDRKTDTLDKAAAGTDVIVNGFNPHYKNWAKDVPCYTTKIIDAAKTSGATVIVPGNVYVYGADAGTWGPDTRHSAKTRKGRIRIEMERAYRDAAGTGVRTIILRAGDFIDPNGADTLMGAVVVKNIHKGVLTHLGPPNVRRAYCYLPDWARAAAALADMRTKLDPFEDVPIPGIAVTMAELRDQIETATRQNIRLSAFPWRLVQLVSPFMRDAYEMLEMRYLHETSHELASGPFNRLLPNFVPTPLQAALLAELPQTMLRRDNRTADALL